MSRRSIFPGRRTGSDSAKCSKKFAANLKIADGYISSTRPRWPAAPSTSSTSGSTSRTAAVEALQADDVARAAAAARRRTRRSTPAAWSASAPGRSSYPGRRRAVRRRARPPGWPGWCATSAGGAPTRSAPRTPRWSVGAAGCRPGWSAPAAATTPATTLADGAGRRRTDGRRRRRARGTSTGRSTVPALLTPHAGELAAMLGVERAEVEARPLRHRAPRRPREYDAVVLLKGRHTLVAAPDGRVRVTTTGVPWLATAGAGDVLGGPDRRAARRRARRRTTPASVGSWLHGAAATLARGGGPDHRERRRRGPIPAAVRALLGRPWENRRMSPCRPRRDRGRPRPRSGTTCARLRELVGAGVQRDGGGQGRRLRPRHGRGRAGRPRGRRRLARRRHHRRGAARCARPATPAGCCAG